MNSIHTIRILLSAFLLLYMQPSKAQFARILLDESFGTNKRNWPIQTEGNPKLFMQEGRYFVQYQPDNKTWKATQPVDIAQWDNISIAASLYFQSGRTGQNGAGIVFGNMQQGRFFQFLIQPDGKFAFFKEENGSIVTLKSYTFNASIRKETNVENRLKVVVQNRSVRLFVNDILVYTESLMPAGKEVGVTVVNNCEVAFDQLQVTSATSNTNDQQLVPDPPKPVVTKSANDLQTVEKQKAGTGNERKPIAVHFKNESGKALYLILSYIPANKEIATQNFIDDYWFKLGKDATVYYFNTHNPKFYFYAEDQVQNFWGTKRSWNGSSGIVVADGKRYNLREVVIKENELVYDAVNDRFVYTMTLTK